MTKTTIVSNDGRTQTTNLFGLSLIHQDNGAETRALLTDGLGSVRLEIVDSAANYEPYGRLCHTGPNDSICTFTSKQHDAASGAGLTRSRCSGCRSPAEWR